MEGVTAVIITPQEFDVPQEIMGPIKTQCNEVIVVKGGSRGWARNEGLRRSRNKYILMVDTDQILLPNYVKRLLEKMNGNVAVCCGVALPQPKLPLTARLEEYFKAIVSFNIKASGAGGNLYCREKVLEVGGFKMDLNEHLDYDYELLQRLRKRYDVTFVPEAILIHLKRYTLKLLIKAGLTCAMTKYVSLFRLFGRTFAAPLRVFQYWKKIYNLSGDESIFLLPFYAMFRQLIFSLCGTLRRGIID